MIEIANISKKFGTKTALEHVNMILNKGEIVALLGENGAGKSTLMRILCGFLRPDAGSVRIDGFEVMESRLEALKKIGYVPEISTLYGDMIVYDFLNWLAKVWRVDDCKKNILNAARQMEILEVLSSRIDTLSKGFKKRVEIAGAILHQPDFLILDEPTDGLDPNQKFDIRQFLCQYAHDKTVFISTHVLEDAAIAKRIVMLAEGKVVRDCSLDEFQQISKNRDLNEAFRLVCNESRKNL